MLADDIKLYRAIRFFEDCLILQNDINVLHDWSKHCLLSRNVKFYKLVMLHTPAIAGIQLEPFEILVYTLIQN